MKKLSLIFLVALVAAISVPSGTPTYAQLQGLKIGGFISNSSYVADSNPVIALKYLGAQPYATVDFNSNKIEFFSGATTGITTVTAGDEIDGSDVGSNTGGVCDAGSTEDGNLDVSEADCDTYKELVDVINASNLWAAELVGALPADTIAIADMLDPASADVAGIGANPGTDYYGMLADDSGFDEIVVLLSPVHDGAYVAGDPRTFFDNDLSTKNNVCAGKRVYLTNVATTIDLTGAGTLTVYSYNMVDLTTSILHVETIVDATQTPFDYSRVPIASKVNECLLVRVSGGTVVTGSLAVNGFYATN